MNLETLKDIPTEDILEVAAYCGYGCTTAKIPCWLADILVERGVIKRYKPLFDF